MEKNPKQKFLLYFKWFTLEIDTLAEGQTE